MTFWSASKATGRRNPSTASSSLHAPAPACTRSRNQPLLGVGTGGALRCPRQAFGSPAQQQSPPQIECNANISTSSLETDTPVSPLLANRPSYRPKPPGTNGNGNGNGNGASGNGASGNGNGNGANGNGNGNGNGRSGSVGSVGMQGSPAAAPIDTKALAGQIKFAVSKDQLEWVLSRFSEQCNPNHLLEAINRKRQLTTNPGDSRYSHSGLLTQLDKIANRLASDSRIPVRQLSPMIFAYATIPEHPTPQALLEQMVSKMSERNSVRDAYPQEVAATIWALAKLGATSRSDLVTSLVDRLLDMYDSERGPAVSSMPSVAPRKQLLVPQGLSLTLWGLAVLEEQESGFLDRLQQRLGSDNLIELFHHLYKSASVKINHFNSQELADMMTAMGILMQRHPACLSELRGAMQGGLRDFTQLWFTAAERKVSGFTMQNCSDLAWSLATCKLFNQEFLASLALNIMAKVKDGVEVRDAQAASIAWSFAMMQDNNNGRPVVGAVSRFITAESDLGTLASLAWAGAGLSWPGSAKTLKLVLDKIQQEEIQLEEVPPNQLLQLLACCQWLEATEQLPTLMGRDVRYQKLREAGGRALSAYVATLPRISWQVGTTQDQVYQALINLSATRPEWEIEDTKLLKGSQLFLLNLGTTVAGTCPVAIKVAYDQTPPGRVDTDIKYVSSVLEQEGWYVIHLGEREIRDQTGPLALERYVLSMLQWVR